jgi:phosphohistidine phosphatase SixA
MKLYLMRHCESEDGPRDDPTRQLTSVGRKQAQTMGQFLVRQIGRVDVVLTSYFARAQGTAAPIAELLGCSNIIDTPALQPDTAPKDAWKEIKFLSDGCEDVLVVSHHPLVNELLKLLTGCDSEKFHHGAIAHIGDDGKLHWFVPPAIVERDEDDVLDAAAGVVEALEAHLQEAKGDGGLKHPRHQAVLSKVRAKVKKIMAGYFDRQGAAVLKSIKPNIQAVIKQYQEANTTGKRFASSLVPTSLQPLRFPITDDEDSDYQAAITAAIKGGAAALAKELESDASLSEDAASDYLLENSLAKLTGGFADETLDRLRNSLADAWDKGGSFNDMTAAIQDTFDDFSDSRAEMIAQTEGNDAYNEGRSALAEEAGMEEKSWETEDDPCDICIGNEGDGWIDIDDNFSSGDDAPTAHPNCFLGGTTVTAAGVTGTVRRWYEGTILQITVGADNLSVTPNHPILGLRGWTRAGSLNVGDYVVQCSAPAVAASILNPHDNHIETGIEKIADSLFMAGGMSAEGVPHTAEAFHGDSGPDGKVDIVRAAGAFPRDWTAGRENGEYSSFGLRHSRRVTFLEQRDFLSMLEGLEFSAHSGMGRSGVSLPLSLGGLRGAEQASLAHAALSESECIPVPHDSDPANADTIGDMKHRLSSLMRLKQVTEVNVIKFAGHVYNLETQDGIYFANSIVTHNCQCSLNFRKGVE